MHLGKQEEIEIMRKETIKDIIVKLKEIGIAKNAYFGFFQYGGGIYESCIKANKEGLLLYAACLLEASLEIDNRDFTEDKIQTYGLSPEFVSENTDFDFHYVELMNKPKLEIETTPEHKETWKDKLTGYIFGAILIFMLISVIIGIGTITSWILHLILS